MWIVYSFIAMAGLVIRYMWAKIWNNANVIMALFATWVLYVMTMPLLSKIFYDKWFDFGNGEVELGLSNMIGGGLLATVFLVLALNSWGKVSNVSVIVESAVVVSVIIWVLFFKETIVWQQIVWILLVVLGIFCVVFFNNN